MFPEDILSSQLAGRAEKRMQQGSRDVLERGYTGTGYWWANYPAYVGGLTKYDPHATTVPGSNLDAVAATPQPGSEAVAQDAGMTAGDVTGASVGGTAAY